MERNRVLVGDILDCAALLEPGSVQAICTTTGWEPTCACPDAGVVPCTILDPFSGSGTTLAVAHEEGRHWLGIDADERAVGWTRARLAGLPVGRLAGM